MQKSDKNEVGNLLPFLYAIIPINLSALISYSPSTLFETGICAWHIMSLKSTRILSGVGNLIKIENGFLHESK